MHLLLPMDGPTIQTSQSLYQQVTMEDPISVHIMYTTYIRIILGLLLHELGVVLGYHLDMYDHHSVSVMPLEVLPIERISFYFML
jgi:hypothetical protein